jgi:hypothetical protein
MSIKSFKEFFKLRTGNSTTSLGIKRTARSGFLSLALLASGCSAFSDETASSREIKNPELRAKMNALADMRAATYEDPVGTFYLYKRTGNVDGMLGVIRSMSPEDLDMAELIPESDIYLEQHPEYIKNNAKLFPELEIRGR